MFSNNWFKTIMRLFHLLKQFLFTRSETIILLFQETEYTSCFISYSTTKNSENYGKYLIVAVEKLKKMVRFCELV